MIINKFDINKILRISGIYFLFNKNLELLYIGKSKDVRTRIQQHTTNNDDNRLTFKNKKQNYITCIPKNEVKYYSIIEIQDEQQRTINELILINILRPRFNMIDKIAELKKYYIENEPQELKNLKELNNEAQKLL